MAPFIALGFARSAQGRLGLRPSAFVVLALACLVLGLSVARAVPPTGTAVLARGSHAVLTEDAADAFHESLLFSLGYIGHADARHALPREAVLSQLAAIFPTLPGEDQRVLASQRLLWEQAQARWESQPVDERRRYVTTLLTFAFGDAATGGGEFDVQVDTASSPDEAQTDTASVPARGGASG
ncbi:MAG: hypothetical protein AAF430_20400 [Myxococcota bacterium]